MDPNGSHRILNLQGERGKTGRERGGYRKLGGIRNVEGEIRKMELEKWEKKGIEVVRGKLKKV
jgi:hypothetical protein